MLHALLRGKLLESVNEVQRREDALTSTVFGTLIAVEAWDVLGRWLGVGDDQLQPGDPRDCWFWPRLAYAEPDVVLRLGDFLIVVEAKLRSGRHDRTGTQSGQSESGDQLVFQHRSVTTPLEKRVRYSDAIECAIRDCHLVQVYLIDDLSSAAKKEFDQSKGELPKDADFRRVTWQGLFAQLGHIDLSERRWAKDLRSYLLQCDLDSFEGIGKGLCPLSKSSLLHEWRHERQHQLCTAVANHARRNASIVLDWRRSTAERGSRLSDSLGLTSLRQAQVIRNWRPSPTERSDHA